MAAIAATTILSCAKQDSILLVNTSDVVLKASQEFTISTNNKATFVSENENVAVVDQKTGVITAVKVGETYIDVVSGNHSSRVKVTVEGNYYTYDEPYLDFGMSRESLLSFYGTPYRMTEDNVSFFYWNAEVPYDGYTFKNGKLDGSYVVFHKDYLNEVGLFLGERYFLASEGTYVNDPVNPSLGIVISRQINNDDYYRVSYMPYMPVLKGNEIPPEQIIDDIIPLFAPGTKIKKK